MLDHHVQFSVLISKSGQRTGGIELPKGIQNNAKESSL